LQKKLWPIESIRETLFKNRTKSDKDFIDFWPSPGYQHFPRINVGNLQTNFIDYLKETYKDKFSIEFKKVEVNDVAEGKDTDIIFVTAGNGEFNKNIRSNLKIESSSCDFTNDKSNIFDGVYLVYNNTESDGKVKTDDYIRDYGKGSQHMNRLELSEAGITYSATNNKNGNVQLYTYDVGQKFQELYKKLTEEVRKSSGWPNFINYHKEEAENEKDLAKKQVIKTWAHEFKTHLNTLLKKFKIDIPADTRIHWAPRLHYAYKHTHAFNKNKIPVVFAGDAMGGTDYKYGLNLGRGLYEADQFVSYLKKSTLNIEKTLNLYKAYWEDVLAKEFGDPKRKLTDDDKIFYKYVIKGRYVDGRVLEDDPKDVQFYIDAIKAKRQKRRLK
jgi:hypothetical protein